MSMHGDMMMKKKENRIVGEHESVEASRIQEVDDSEFVGSNQKYFDEMNRNIESVIESYEGIRKELSDLKEELSKNDENNIEVVSDSVAQTIEDIEVNNKYIGRCKTEGMEKNCNYK